MTYGEYYLDHENENPGWCKVYGNREGDHFRVMYEGTVLAVSTPKIETWRRNGILPDVLESFAREVNAHYDDYAGYSDEYIAIQALEEKGCASCPFFDGCELMNTEMEG